MSKSFRNKDFYDDYDYEEVNNRHGKKKSNKKNDKKLEIQQARKKAQAERDRAANGFLGFDD